MYNRLMRTQEITQSSKEEIYKQIEGCLWSMIDTYNYWKSIDHALLCSDTEFWRNVSRACKEEWEYLKSDLTLLLWHFVPVKCGVFWTVFAEYSLQYSWPGMYSLHLRGADKTSQQWHCLCALFESIEDETMPYKKDGQWVYPSSHVYLNFNEFDGCTIHLMG